MTCDGATTPSIHGLTPSLLRHPLKLKLVVIRFGMRLLSAYFMPMSNTLVKPLVTTVPSEWNSSGYDGWVSFRIIPSGTWKPVCQRLDSFLTVMNSHLDFWTLLSFYVVAILYPRLQMAGPPNFSQLHRRVPHKQDRWVKRTTG